MYFAVAGKALRIVVVQQGGDVGFDAVEYGVQIDAGGIGAYVVQPRGGVVSAFAHGAVVNEIAVQFRVLDFPSVVGLFQFLRGNAVASGKAVQDEIEVSGFGFFRPAAAFVEVSVQPDVGEQVGLRVHPYIEVFVDGYAQMLVQPAFRQAVAVAAVKRAQIRGVAFCRSI